MDPVTSNQLNPQSQPAGIPFQPVPVNEPAPFMPPPPPVKKSNRVLIAGIVLLVLSLVSVSAYFTFQYYQLKSAVVVSPSPVVVSTPVATTDPTANWKIYTNNKYLFSFKYPPNITFTENTAGNNQSVLELDWHQDSPYFEFIFQLTPMTPKDIISLTIGAGGNKEEFMTIDGVKGTKLNADGGIGGSVKQTVVYFIRNNMTYYFFTGGNPELTNQILSTFKFLSENSKGICKANFEIAPSSELSAEQNLSLSCSSKQNKTDCEATGDSYNKNLKDFSAPDGIADCIWI